MAFASLFSCPLNPVNAKTMTDCELAGAEREDGELEDGEIDDEGAGIEEEKKVKLDCKDVTTDKDKEKVQETQSHRHAHKKKIKNKRKMKEKRKLKRKRRDRQKNGFPSSGPDSDSYDSDFDLKHKPKSKKCKGPHEDYDDPITQEHHRKPPRLTQYKTNDSDENYDYDDEQDDFNEELSKYQQAKKLTTSSQCTAGPKENAVQQRSGGIHGQGYDRGGVGRGSHVMNKNKKLKGKSWSWGRGQGGEPKFRKGTKEEAQCQPGFQKKHPVMSQVFISQHTVEHNGRNVCKYFLEGRCIKGDQCKFDHDNVVPQKKKDLCKFYVQGYCTKGENCTYMHNEYPCKFFHTGTKCYQGDHCKFSHDPLTELTKQLLDKVLNTDEEHVKENHQDLEDLKMNGIVPLTKPPPGVGLLPTPGSGSPQDSSMQIPSLFEIKVQPTVDLAQKIALRPNFYNSTSPPSEQFQGNGTSVQPSDSSDEMHTRNVMPAGNSHALLPPSPSPGTIGTSIQFPVSSFSQSPPRPAAPQGFGQNTHIPPPVLSSQGSGFHQNVNSHMNQQGANTQSEFFKNLFNIQSLGMLEEGQSMASNDSQHYQEGSTESFSGVQNLPPAIQQALLFHLNQNQQASDSPTTKKKVSLTYRGDKEETSWYSSCDEDSSSVTTILQTLKKQNDLMKNQHSQAKLQQPGISLSPQADPRLHKERTLSTDFWVKTDPRQHFPDGKKEGNMVSDPRLARDPNTTRTLNTFKMDPKQNVHPNSSVVQKLSTGDDDDEAEREPRNRAVLIPIDPAPGAMLQDPRCQIKKFSHIRVDFLLQRPVFADSVVWAPEDLIPSLIPKQELSINLPLPPLVADAQLKRSRTSCTDSFTSAPASPDPRLVGIRLQEDKGGPGLSARRTQKRCNSEKPSDPRTQKDPSTSRSVSLDSKKTKKKGCNDTVSDPRLQKSQTTNAFKSDSEKLPPYVPHQASSTAGGLKNPTSLLEGISLNDPLNHTLLSPNNLAKEPLKKAGILKKSIPVAPQTGEDKDLNRDTESHSSDTQLDQAIHTEEPNHASTTDHVAAPAMHYLPIQPLAGLIRPAYTDPRQNRSSKQAAGVQEDEEVEEEQTVNNRPLRNAFKTFDPMASSFCQ